MVMASLVVNLTTLENIENYDNFDCKLYVLLFLHSICLYPTERKNECFVKKKTLVPLLV